MPDLEDALSRALRDAVASVSFDPQMPPQRLNEIRQRRRRNRTVASLAAVLAVAVIGSVAVGISTRRASVDSAATPTTVPIFVTSSTDTTSVTVTVVEPTTAPPTTTAPPISMTPTFPSVEGPSVPLTPAGAMSCVSEYNLSRLAVRSFAFEGTVTSIAGSSDGPQAGAILSVTFDVAEWFKGGSGQTVEVLIDAPASEPSTAETDLADSKQWGVGSRLLITGDRINPSDPASSLRAWMCGFSRTYDTATADQWRSAFQAATPETGSTETG